MARAVGIGGVFFKAQDPEGLARWYERWLGMPVHSAFCGTVFASAEMPAGGYAVWSPFEAGTEYFAPSDLPFMINLVVDDLDGALAQVVEGGAAQVGEPSDDELGRFGWFLDPAGNKVELWQPPAGAR